MLNVILHIPVTKTNETTGGETATTETEVVHVGSETNMLRDSAERFEPSAVLAAKGEDNDQIPMACNDKDRGES